MSDYFKGKLPTLHCRVVAADYWSLNRGDATHDIDDCKQISREEAIIVQHWPGHNKTSTKSCNFQLSSQDVSRCLVSREHQATNRLLVEGPYI